jgi:hypothetical protein
MKVIVLLGPLIGLLVGTLASARYLRQEIAVHKTALTGAPHPGADPPGYRPITCFRNRRDT